MPHLILEHSAELNADAITTTCEALFKAANANLVFTNKASIKLRSVPCHNVYMGTSPATFAHLTVWMLAGRSDDEKNTLSRALLDVTAEHLPDVGALTVDPQDMNTNTYAKRVI
jgi:5-carboxymethyl-2-hydroxymuconate isomerase